ncbi:hypothetical protein BGX27_007965 [Mortierella sp. AM989]|nr:hypothetical protein BGX27_007965 [Mortierella sp. AM989]
MCCKPVKTVLDESQMRELENVLSPGGMIRVRLLNQLEFPKKQPNSNVEISISFKSEDSSNLMLNFIEFCNRPTSYNDTEEYVLVGESKPHKVISVMHDDNSEHPRPNKKAPLIKCFSASASGSYIATLSFTNGCAYVDLWDLGASVPMSSYTQPQYLSTPHATISIELSQPYDDTCSYFIGITGSGSMISLCPHKPSDHSIPFSVFGYAPTLTASQGLVHPLPLEMVDFPDSLRNHYGYGAFHCIDTCNPTEQNDRFVACNGTSADIFRVDSEPWILQNTIRLRLEQTLSETLSYLSSKRNRCFIWSGVKNTKTFLDIKSGTRRVEQPIYDNSHGIFHAAASSDGSLYSIYGPQGTLVSSVSTKAIVGSYLCKGKTIILDSILEKKYLVIHEILLPPGDIDRHLTIKILGIQKDMPKIFEMLIYQDYKMLCLPRSEDLLMGYHQGSILSIVRYNNIIPTREPEERLNHSCELQSIPLYDIPSDFTLEYRMDAGPTLELKNSFFREGENLKMFKVKAIFNNNPRKHSTIIFGPTTDARNCSILQNPPQLLIFTSDGIQVWNIPLTEANNFELTISLVFSFQASEFLRPFRSWTVTGVKACMECRKMEADYISQPTATGEDEPITNTNHFFSGTGLFIPRSSESIVEKLLKNGHHIYHAMLGVIQAYTSGNENVKKAVIRHMKALVQPNSMISSACLDLLCMMCPTEGYDQLRRLMVELLNHDSVTWAPAQEVIEISNPLATLLRRAETTPTATDIIKIILDYCSYYACKEKDLRFFSPVFPCLKDLIVQFPDMALHTIGRMSYVESRDQSHYLHNHTIAYPPSFRRLLLRLKPPPIYKMDKNSNPVLQFHRNQNPKDPRIRGFSNKLYRASYDALWSYIKIPTESGVSPLSWLRIIFEVIKLKLLSRNQIYVECNDFDIEHFSNPAIDALVAYKWNTIGFYYWIVRFTSQCIYYLLVYTATFMQLYYNRAEVLEKIFVTTIAFAALFLYLECGQFIQNVRSYKRYNLLDLIAFGFPLAASIYQTSLIRRNDAEGVTWPLSFSTLIVSLHLLFELRINKSVGKYVTIIQKAVVEIKVFFMIFAGVVLIFALSFAHVIHSCPINECERTSDFPKHYFGAFVSTFFFMGGRYDPVGKDFEGDNWPFHIMMVLFLFTAVILLLNVLIALINVAFTKGDDGWRLAWIENRLRYIERAENMSYNIPGFRTSFDYFPTEILYTASKQQADDYLDKLNAKFKDGAGLTRPTELKFNDIYSSIFESEEITENANENSTVGSSDSTIPAAASSDYPAQHRIDGQKEPSIDHSNIRAKNSRMPGDRDTLLSAEMSVQQGNFEDQLLSLAQGNQKDIGELKQQISVLQLSLQKLLDNFERMNNE